MDKKIILFNDKILTYNDFFDSVIKKYYKKGYKKIYFTSKNNFKIAKKYLSIRKQLNPEEKLQFLLKNLETKDYFDYPVYLFFYGKKLLYKEFLKKYIIQNENEQCIKILTDRIERLIKHKQKIIVTFDNFHLIRFKNNKANLIYYKDIENIYRFEGYYLWINLAGSDNVRFLNFDRLKIYGKIYDPFTLWKLSFLNEHDFEVI